MIRAITFIPASGGTEGLTYVERASRNRSLHVLLQDSSFKGSAATHPASRRNFLRNAYREIISRYVTFGRIEQPLPLARSLVNYLDTLSKRVDCRVDDFRGIGFYALFQDGSTFFLLTSREGRARIRTARGFEPLTDREIGGVTELAVEASGTQKELFSNDVKDFVSLYKIEGDAVGAGGALELSLGGSGEEMDTLLEALDQPGVVEESVTDKTIPLNLISHKMMFIRFDGLVRTRELYRAGVDPSKGSRRGRRAMRAALPAVAAVAVLWLGALWISERLAGEGSQAETVVRSQPAAEQPSTEGAPASPPEAEGAGRHPVGDTQADDEPGFRFAVAWKKSYSDPVTSTPLLEGERVFFASRDRHLYALEQESGAVAWRYRATNGMGASPALSGGHIVGADYGGNVFALDAANGRRVWNRKLPGKVVSSPCVGGGEVLVGCYDGSAYALSTETGRVLWRLRTGGRIRGTSAFADGTFFVPSYDGYIYAVAAGKVDWRVNLGGQVSSSPAIGAGRVVVGSANGGIYGLERGSGTVVWRHETGAPVKSFVVIANGRAYAGSNNNALYCLDAGVGKVLWKFTTGGPVLGRPVVTGPYVVFPSYDGYVYCVNVADGTQVDRFQTGGAVFSSPVIGGGKAFFGNNSGKFYCLKLRGEQSS